MYHHSVSICRDLLFDEVVIENTQSDDILKWQSDPDRFLGFDWVYSQDWLCVAITWIIMIIQMQAIVFGQE